MESLPLPPDGYAPRTIPFEVQVLPKKSFWARCSPFVLAMLVGAWIGGSLIYMADRHLSYDPTGNSSIPVIRRERNHPPYFKLKKAAEPPASVKKNSAKSSSKKTTRTRKPWLSN